MIWLEEKYAPCIKALEAAGLLEWRGTLRGCYDSYRLACSFDAGFECCVR